MNIKSYLFQFLIGTLETIWVFSPLFQSNKFQFLIGTLETSKTLDKDSTIW